MPCSLGEQDSTREREREIHPEFQNVKYLGIYNPRLNEVYRISVDDILRDVITEVERDVIGYAE